MGISFYLLRSSSSSFDLVRNEWMEKWGESVLWDDERLSFLANLWLHYTLKLVWKNEGCTVITRLCLEANIMVDEEPEYCTLLLLGVLVRGEGFAFSLMPMSSPLLRPPFLSNVFRVKPRLRILHVCFMLGEVQDLQK